jgi:hypothetical protein
MFPDGGVCSGAFPEGGHPPKGSKESGQAKRCHDLRGRGWGGGECLRLADPRIGFDGPDRGGETACHLGYRWNPAIDPPSAIDLPLAEHRSGFLGESGGDCC